MVSPKIDEKRRDTMSKAQPIYLALVDYFCLCGLMSPL